MVIFYHLFNKKYKPTNFTFKIQSIKIKVSQKHYKLIKTHNCLMIKVLKKLLVNIFKLKKSINLIMKIDLKNLCLDIHLFSIIWNPELYNLTKLDKGPLKILMRKKMETVRVYFRR